ncbi:MAG: SDR family oxidoreductase [Pseudomonadota bacterium]|nr:SDR family oxidoreductase [Pseudomonadota bacterium]
MNNENFSSVCKNLEDSPRLWLVTGVAGFIGSHLLEELLKLNQKVIGLDNFITGFESNLDEVKSLVSAKQWKNFSFFKGDITSIEDCKKVFALRPEFVLHQAALGSVPRSIENPIATNHHNVTGFLNVIEFAKNVRVKGFVYASSSAVYGDHPELPKVEERIGNCLSPYAVSKKIDEQYADVFNLNYGFRAIGLRYFNVFGARQSPNGPYAAVIPKWIDALAGEQTVLINGDGETSRDFCYVKNVVQANILAAAGQTKTNAPKIFNIACGDRTTLNELYRILKDLLVSINPNVKNAKATYQDFRAGDVKHSLADISNAKQFLGYEPKVKIGEGLKECFAWYLSTPKAQKSS